MLPLLIITRTTYDAKSTVGTVRVVDKGQTLFNGWSLELPWKDNRNGESCIPAGDYLGLFTDSPKFKRKVWLVHAVPKRSGIRVHSAAIAIDHLLGCIAIGMGVRDVNKDGSTDLLRSKEGMWLFEDTLMALAVKDPKHKALSVGIRIVSGNNWQDGPEGKQPKPLWGAWA